MGIPPTSKQWPEGYAFLIRELELAATFLLIARDARASEKARRNRRHARLAYESVQRFRSHVQLTEAAWESIELRLEDLRSSLVQLGELF